MSSKKEISDTGSVFWTLDGDFHNLDGPAIIENNGTEHYYNYNKRHRTDGPAYISTEGSVFYYSHNSAHRMVLPAIIHPHGREEYWEFGGFVKFEYVDSCEY